MFDSNIKVENMSHIAATFPLRKDEEDIIHPTQLGKEKIKLLLFFLIPGEEPNTNIPRVASVRVPKGTPIAKLRLLIKHCENNLQEIYGRSKRLNFIMSCPENSEKWVYDFDLPTFGVVYV